ncbi:MAG: hypothetical protein ACI9F9_001783 [Candidatus Paceibacteria bacterium]|jgi:hypothetical protein
MLQRLFLLLCPLLLTIGGCQSLGPPPTGLESQLTDNGKENAQRHTARVTIQSDWFGGEFTALAVSSGGDSPAVRFQLLPNFGGKILDVLARADDVVAHWPHEGKVDRERKALIGFLAVSLMERAVPITWDRVLRGRTTESGYHVQLQPASHGLDLTIHADLSRSGKLEARHYQLGLVKWSEEFEPEHRFVAREFTWTFLEESDEQLESAPAALFVLVPETGNE